MTPRRPAEEESVLEFLRLLWKIDHSLQRLSKAMLKRLGVTGPQRLALRLVARTPGISLGDLSRSLCLHPSTVTGIVQRLEQKGFITRSTASTDARRTELRLSPSANRLTRPLPGTVEDATWRTVERVGASQVVLVQETLVELAAQLDAAAEITQRSPRRASTSPTTTKPRRPR
jgi:DNA-binding MarR family transcriptional regulator